MKSNEYKCEECGEIFEKGWTDAEAAVEFAETFPGFDLADSATVCDDCYKRIFGIATGG